MTELQKQQISTLRSKGKGYGEIATTLNISKNTVKSYCRRKGMCDSPQTLSLQNNINCKQCGQPILPATGNRQKIFCNEKCRIAWWNANRNNPSHQVLCTHCNSTFNNRGNKARKYCSHQCYISGRFGKAEATQ